MNNQQNMNLLPTLWRAILPQHCYMLFSISLLAAVLSPSTYADDLQQIFVLAVQKDPEILQARARYNATHTQLDQGRSTLLPSLSATAKTSRDTSGLADINALELNDSRRKLEHRFSNGYNTKSYGLNLKQALIDFQAWYSFQSAKRSDEAATLTLAQAEQQLIVKVSKAYFNVLRSQANLASFFAQETAATQVLNQAQQRFDAGVVAITDVYDSQAAADLASVNRLEEENNLSQWLEALKAITGQRSFAIASLREDFPISEIDPTSINEWEQLAQQNNLAIKIAELDLQAKQNDAKAVRAQAWPKVEIAANYNWQQSANPFSFTQNLAAEGSSVALNFSIPLYSGGLNSARTRQAYYTRDSSEQVLQKSKRENIQDINNTYRSVEKDIKAVAARTRAVSSAQSKLKATELGSEAGTRNIVDVVQSQQLLFQAQRDHANARFTYVLDTIALKQAAGVLSPQDVEALNEWLQE